MRASTYFSAPRLARWAGWTCFGFTILAAAAGVSAQEKAVISSSARLEATAGVTRLTFALSQPVEATAFVMVRPDRVIVDLPEIEFRFEGAPPPPPQRARSRGRTPATVSNRFPGLVAGYRFGLFAPGKSRVVIDLAGPARIVRAASEADGGAARLVIELAATDRSAFAAAARQRPPAPPPLAVAPPPMPPANAAELPLIVIDPGHGGLDPGARASNGTQEKDVVFDFSHGLQTRVEATGRYRVMMTRASDVFIPLDERVKIARDAGASLFISIHADTIGYETGISGATVYTGADKASDRQAARVADSENRADAAAGIEPAQDDPGVSEILFDLTRRETRAYSHVFARTLIGYLRNASRMNKNPHRSAGFRVLKAPDVPAVLLELGYLSSAKDLANLVAPEWRQKAADNVLRAIDDFFRTRDGKAVRADGPFGLKRDSDFEAGGVVAGAQR